MKIEKCLHCSEIPAIFPSKNAEVTTWNFRHECKAGMIANGKNLKSEEMAIKAWNEMREKMKDKEIIEAMKPLRDPYQLAIRFAAESQNMQGMAAMAKKAGRSQQADVMIMTSVLSLLRSDIWYQIFVDKCYKEGMKPDEIFSPPKKAETQT